MGLMVVVVCGVSLRRATLRPAESSPYIFCVVWSDKQPLTLRVTTGKFPRNSAVSAMHCSASKSVDIER